MTDDLVEKVVEVAAEGGVLDVVEDIDPHELLKPRGRALYDELMLAAPTSRTRQALALEAARQADRLDHLQRVLAGDTQTWLVVSLPARDEGPLVLQVGNAMVEARQTATSLRSLLGQLAAQEVADGDRAAGGAGTSSGEAGGGGGYSTDEVAARRAAREADARSAAAAAAGDPAGG